MITGKTAEAQVMRNRGRVAYTNMVVSLIGISVRWGLSNADVAAMLGKDGDNLAAFFAGESPLKGRDACARYQKIIRVAAGVASLARSDFEYTTEHEWVRVYRPDLSDSPLHIMLKGTMGDLDRLVKWIEEATG